MHALIKRTQFIKNGDMSKKREVKHICTELPANGYPQPFITKATKKKKKLCKEEEKKVTLRQLAFRTAEALVRLSDEFLPGLDSGQS